MKNNKSIFLSDAFREFITASATGKRRMASGKKISTGVIQNYGYALQQLEAFEQKMGTQVRIVPLSRASAALLAREQRYWKKFFKGFCTFFYRDRAYFDNFVGNIFKILRTLFNYLNIEKAIPSGNFHRLFKVPQQQAMPVVMLPEQVHFLIHDTFFCETLPTMLKRTKDIVVFGCTTGLRISDLMALKQKNLVKDANETWLCVYTQKTNTRIMLPLPPYCIEILQKYRNKSGSYLLPRLSNTNINLHMKEIGRLAGWTWTLPKFRTRGGKLVEIKTPGGQSWKFYQHLTAHTMRRTAITTLLMLGVDETVVRRMSGHAPGSKEFFKYIAVAQGYMDNQVKTAFKRLAETPDYYRRRE